MITAILQVVVAVLTLVFTVLACLVARQRGGVTAVQRAAWIIVAVFFVWRAVPGILQSAFMYWGVESGAGSRPYTLVVRWTPAMNYLRAMPALAVGWILAGLHFFRIQPSPRLWWGAAGVCLMLAATGAYGGWREGATSEIHLVGLTVLGAVELVGLLAALMVGLLAYTIDRYLWIILCLFAVQVALNVVWYSASAGFFYPGGWSPPASVRYLHSTTILMAGCALAWYRLVVGRREVRVTGFLEVFGGGAVISEPGPGRGKKGRAIVDG